MSKTKLKIKEFSQLCQVTAKTLRHNEKIGLLMPAEVDEWRVIDIEYCEQIEEMGK